MFFVFPVAWLRPWRDRTRMVAVEAEILGYVAESVGFLLTPVRDKMGSSERGYS